jgi:2-iminobutanoate/2-iminopropanoate deaminase
MSKKIIYTPDAPNPIGPYNQATLMNNFLFISGQIAIDPGSGELVIDSIENETHQVLKNLGAILKAAGFGFDDVLKASVFVKNMGDFARINSVYAQYFDESTAPARELVEVVNLPRYVNIEISVIASK